MSETTTDLAVLIEQGRARGEIGRPVAIHGSGCPDDGTVNLWDAHERLLMDSMSEGEANEIAWWLNNGSALLDAAQSAQQRAEAAERRANALIMELAAEKQRNWDETRDSLRQDRDTARAENVALREALAWYRDRAALWCHADAGGFDHRNFDHDHGERARAALASGEGTA